MVGVLAGVGTTGGVAGSVGILIDGIPGIGSEGLGIIGGVTGWDEVEVVFVPITRSYTSCNFGSRD